MIPGPGEPGNETWPGETWKTGGASTWQTGAYDPETEHAALGHRQPRPLELGPAQGRQQVELLAASRSTSTPARSSGATSTRRTTPGTTTATTRRSCSTSRSTASRARWRCSRTATASSTCSTGPTASSSTPCRRSRASTGPPASTRRPAGRPSTRRSGRRAAAPRSSRSCPGLEGGTNWFPIAADPEQGHRLPQHQRLGDVAHRLEARGRRLQGRRRPTWASTTRCTGTRSRPATSRPSTSRTGSGCGSCRARCRCSRACWRPRAALALHRRPARLLQGGRRRDRQGAVEVPDRLRHQRLADHLRARRQAVRGDPVRPRRRSRASTSPGPKGGMLWVFAVDGEVAGHDRHQRRRSSRRCCRSMASRRHQQSREYRAMPRWTLALAPAAGAEHGPGGGHGLGSGTGDGT